MIACNVIVYSDCLLFNFSVCGVAGVVVIVCVIAIPLSRSFSDRPFIFPRFAGPVCSDISASWTVFSERVLLLYSLYLFLLAGGSV